MAFHDTFPAHHSVDFAARAVRGGMTVIGNLVDNRQIYKIPKPDGTDLTNGDIAVDDHMHDAYVFDDVIIRSEERQPFPVPRPDAPRPILYFDQDPNDGTTNFWEAYEKSIATGEPMITGAMTSVGATYEGEIQPHWAVVGGQFLRDGPRLYVAERGSEAYYRNLKTGEKRVLTPDASGEGKKVVMVASENSRRKFGDKLMKAGFDVALNKTSVANMLAVCDPTLIEQFRPDLKNRVIGGAVLESCHDWDIAGVLPFAEATGRKATGKTGDVRRIGLDERGGVVTDTEETHERVMDVIRRAA